MRLRIFGTERKTKAVSYPESKVKETGSRRICVESRDVTNLSNMKTGNCTMHLAKHRSGELIKTGFIWYTQAKACSRTVKEKMGKKKNWRE